MTTSQAKPLALVTVLATKGSAPRHPGSKMLVAAEDEFSGTIGGGKGELIALRAAAEAIRKMASTVIEVEMLGAEATGPSMICGKNPRNNAIFAQFFSAWILPQYTSAMYPTASSV